MKKRKDGRFSKTITIDGKRLYFYSSESTEKKAEKDIERQLLLYQQKKAAGMKFVDVIDEWEELHYAHLEQTTIYGYKALTKKLKKHFPDEYIKDIQLNDLYQFLCEMARKRYTTKTIHEETSVIKMIFRYACQQRYINQYDNPTTYLSHPKGERSIVREAISNEEMQNISLNSDSEMGRMAYFLMYTGLRRGEIIPLTWNDIDMDKRIIHIDKAVYYDGNKPILKSTKTEAGNRDIIILDCLYEKMKSWKKDSIYVFHNNNKMYTESVLTKRWKQYRESINLPNLTLHMLRHTFCTLLYEAGIHIKDAQKIMGHADINTTQSRYTHVRDNQLHISFEKLNKSVSQQNNVSTCCQTT